MKRQLGTNTKNSSDHKKKRKEKYIDDEAKLDLDAAS